jgi:neutral trehalase
VYDDNWCSRRQIIVSRPAAVLANMDRSQETLLSGTISLVCRDFPNAWAPVVDMIIEGLDASGFARGKLMAKEIARNWLRSNYMAFQKVGKMIEKYDATSCGKIGGGGEYNPQVTRLNPTLNINPGFSVERRTA